MFRRRPDGDVEPRPRALKPGLLIIFIGLSACATQEGNLLPEISDWETRKTVLEQAGEWEFAGRIGVSAGADGFNGKLWWRQDGVVFRARISGPLGLGTIFINGDRRELTLTDRDGTVTELEDAETDLRARYGWTIPVVSLHYWALGIPDPASPAEVIFGKDGLLRQLTQRNWQVSFDRYTERGGQPMPRVLTAVHEDIKVRLVIHNWNFR